MNRLYFSFLLTLMYSCGNGKTEYVTVAQDTVPKNQETKPIITKKITDNEFIEKFTELGYFDYTEKDKLKIIQDSLKKHFNGDKEFFTEYNRRPPFQFYDSRFYNCGDGEELYEEGELLT